MIDLAEQQKLAMESILENEALTSNLDDQAANVLLNWVEVCVKLIVQSLASVSETDFSTLLDERMSALRRLMRAVNRWAGKSAEMDDSAAAEWLDLLLSQAAIVYGKALVELSAEKKEAFIKQNFRQPAIEMLRALRLLLEPDLSKPDVPPTRTIGRLDLI